MLGLNDAFIIIFNRRIDDGFNGLADGLDDYIITGLSESSRPAKCQSCGEE